jgi:hypothetical protein
MLRRPSESNRLNARCRQQKKTLNSPLRHEEIKYLVLRAFMVTASISEKLFRPRKKSIY